MVHFIHYFDLNYNAVFCCHFLDQFYGKSKISTKTCFSMLKHSFPYNWFEKNLVFKFWTYSLPFFNLAHWGFKKISFTLYTYVLAKILQNGAKFVQKLTPGFKNHMRNLDNFRQAVESLKRSNLICYFCPKNSFVQKIHSFSWKIIYIGFIWHYFQLLVWKFTKLLMSFLKPKAIFSGTAPLYFFSSNITYFLQKYPRLSDFSLLESKFTKFLMSFFKQKISFSSKFGSFFSVMRDNSSVLF